MAGEPILMTPNIYTPAINNKSVFIAVWCSIFNWVIVVSHDPQLDYFIDLKTKLHRFVRTPDFENACIEMKPFDHVGTVKLILNLRV